MELKEELEKLRESFTKVKDVHHYAVSDSCDSSVLRQRIRDLVRQTDYLYFERDLWRRSWSVPVRSLVVETPVTTVMPVTTTIPVTTVAPVTTIAPVTTVAPVTL